MTVVRICDPGGGGLLLPLDQKEHDLDAGLRGLIYAAALIYFFLGIAIIADRFMAAIEAITSRRRQVKRASGGFSTSHVWNETVANLSLMALGSSAPEIFLSVIETAKKGQHAGELGSSTIVGSAAFNLLVIVGVCMLFIPKGESRKMDRLPVFYVTAAASLGAYLWLVLVLTIRTPDVVDVEEALLTFAFLPLLIWVSYRVDLYGYFGVFPTSVRVKLEATFDMQMEAQGSSEEASCITFSTHTVFVQAKEDKQSLDVVVKRTIKGDGGGSVGCAFSTTALTALPGCDYEHAEGALTFDEGVTEQTISLDILPKSNSRAADKFIVVLYDAEDGACFNPEDDGGASTAILTVQIGEFRSPEPGLRGVVRRFDVLFDVDKLRLAGVAWVEQFPSAWYCNGSREDQGTATKTDWALHVAALPWKLLFAVVPSVELFGGWVCFYTCIAFIALFTGVVCDLAELFGCVLDVPNIVTATTFVALGTSMPDLFASLSASADDPTADAAIINVTGSNSVNVFLGLGLPWTIASIFWAFAPRTQEWEELYPAVAASRSGAAFVVESANLGFCVCVFCGCCCAGLVQIVLRRRVLGFELGGPLATKAPACVSFVTLWFGYITLASWRVLRWQKADFSESVVMIGGVCAGMALVALLPLAQIMRERQRQRDSLRGSFSLPAEKAEKEGTCANSEESADCVSNASVCTEGKTPIVIPVVVTDMTAKGKSHAERPA